MINSLHNAIVLFIVCLFLTACIQVKNENGYWDKGNIDIDLIGDWLDEQNIVSGNALSAKPDIISVRPSEGDRYLQIMVN